MDRQRIFDKVARHLLTQGKKAVDDTGRCMYRAPDGCQCGIGCLIPDDLYNPGMERAGIFVLFRGVKDGREIPGAEKLREYLEKEYGKIADKSDSGIPYWYPPDVAFLCSLQGCHDSFTVEEWPEQLRKIARNNALSDAIIQSA